MSKKAPESLEPTFDFDYLRTLVRQHCGVVFNPEQSYLAELRLRPLVEALRLNSLAELVHYLQIHPFGPHHVQAIESLMINETSFFRDQHPFAALKTHLLPQLIQERQAQQVLTIWSAGCATGQEPYSIALLIREHFPQLLDWQLQIIGSDISGRALARAKQGFYSPLEVQRGLPPHLLHRYFQPQEQGWQLQPQIRQMVKFQQLNLLKPWLLGQKPDIIFLRNVLIYFSLNDRKQIFDQLQQCLQTGGYLFLGGGEMPPPAVSGFQRLDWNKSIGYKLISTR